MALWPHYVPLLCSCPCPRLMPPPQTLWSLISCAPCLGLSGPGQAMCPLPGFHDPSEVWNLCLDFFTSTWVTSPRPRSVTSPVWLGAPRQALCAPGPGPLPRTVLQLIHHLDFEAALLTRAPLLLSGTPGLALHAGAQVLTEPQTDLGGEGADGHRAGPASAGPLPPQPHPLAPPLWHRAQPLLPAPPAPCRARGSGAHAPAILALPLSS